MALKGFMAINKGEVKFVEHHFKEGGGQQERLHDERGATYFLRASGESCLPPAGVQRFLLPPLLRGAPDMARLLPKRLEFQTDAAILRQGNKRGERATSLSNRGQKGQDYH